MYITEVTKYLGYTQRLDRNIVRPAMAEFTHWKNQNLIDYKNVFTYKKIYYISQLDSLNSESNKYFNI